MPDSIDTNWLIDLLIPQMQAVRQRRLTIENEWLLNYRAWQGWPSQQYQLPLPDNAIHYFIPFARRGIERSVTRISEIMMPRDEWHRTLPFDGKSHENAEAVHNVIRFLNEEFLPTDANIPIAARSLQLYSFACLHTSVMLYQSDVWPYQEVVDPFSFYVFPETAHDASRAQIIFKDFIIPYQVYKAYVNKDSKKSIYKDLDIRDLTAVNWPYHLIERLAYRGLTSPSDWMAGTGNVRRMNEVEMREKLSENRDKVKSELSRQADAFVELSHVYFRLDSRWFYAVICKNVRESVGLNKHNSLVVRLDQEETVPRYRWAVGRGIPGELYSNSKMDDIRVLQNLANNAISDVEANRTQVQANPIAVDSTMAGRMEEKQFGNRKFWYIPGSPKDAIQSVNVEDVSTNGIRAWQIYLALIDKNSGGTLAEGQPGRNMPRAGFATKDLLNMSLVDIKDDAKILERRLFGPGLSDIYHTILEYVPSKQLIRIPNVNPQLVKAYKKTDLYGDYHFTWLGSLGSASEEEVADKLMQFGQMIFNPQVFPIVQQQLAEQGMKLDLVFLMKRMYSLGIGERGLGQIVVPLTDEEKQKLNQPSPEQQKAEQEMKMKQAEMQQNMQMKQQDHQLKMQQLQAKAQTDMRVQQSKAQVDTQKHQQDMQVKQAETQGKLIDMQVKRANMYTSLMKPIDNKKDTNKKEAS